ncbi:hypothetical protein BSKO_00535 [Bryopsis sp. KO-2023]|nr:hypothetical protein BSKO_00535 [Bryopsis sp. KO-2023]
MRGSPLGTSTSEPQRKSSRKKDKTKYRKLDLWSTNNDVVQKEPSGASRLNRTAKYGGQQREGHQVAIRGTSGGNGLSEAVRTVQPRGGVSRGERRHKVGASQSSTEGEGLQTLTPLSRHPRNALPHCDLDQSGSVEESNGSHEYLYKTSSPCGSSRQCSVIDQDMESWEGSHMEREDWGNSPNSGMSPNQCKGEDVGGWLGVPDLGPSGESHDSPRAPISTEGFQALWTTAWRNILAGTMDSGEGDPQEVKGDTHVTEAPAEEDNHSATRERQTSTRRKKNRWKKVDVAAPSMPPTVDTPPRSAVRCDSLSKYSDQEDRYLSVVTREPSKASSNLTGSCNEAPERPPAAKPGVWSKKDVSSRILSKFGSEGGTPYVKAIHGSTATGSPEYYEAKCGLVGTAEREKTDAARKRRVVVQKDFKQVEKVDGRKVNVVGGLELYKNILSAAEQETLVHCIEQWLDQGERGKLLGRTYTAPKKWLKGKGRRTVQFGCCYNYAVDNQGRKPGIITEEAVEPMPLILTALSQRLVRWGILPSSKKPDSGIVNVYEEGDCIPPHIDNHDFDRPFVTISLVSTAAINFGARLQVLGPGDFSSSFQLMLPPGSCLVLKGNGADIAQHCIPSVKSRRISITLRSMSGEFKQAIDKSKRAKLDGWTTTCSAFNPA